MYYWGKLHMFLQDNPRSVVGLTEKGTALSERIRVQCAVVEPPMWASSVKLHNLLEASLVESFDVIEEAMD